MGFTSMDDFINEVTNNGNFLRTDWNKNFLPTTPAVAGEWFCLARGQGNPNSGSIYNTGTNLTFQTASMSNNLCGGIIHGGDVTGSGYTKHIINASAFSSAATTMPAVLMLVDLVGFIRVTSTTTTGNQNIINTVTQSRYQNGEGLQAFMWANNPTPLGAGTPNLSITYTSSAGLTNRTTPSTLPIGKTAAANGLILYSGTGVGKYGPFLPLTGSDTGIKQISQVNLSSTYTSGEFSIGLCRPLLTLPMTTLGVAAERDLMNQIPSLPRVYDDACLVWLLYNGANTPINSSFFGHLDFAWG